MKSTLINNLDNEESNLSKEENNNDFDSAPIIETQIPFEKDNNNKNIVLIQTNIPPEEEKQKEKNEGNYKKENLSKYSHKKKNKAIKQNQEDNEMVYQQKVINLNKYNQIVIKPLSKDCLNFIKVFLFVFGLATVVDIIMQIILKSRGNNFIYDDLLYIIFFSIQCYYKDRVYNSVKFFRIFFLVFFLLNYLGIGLVFLYCKIRHIKYLFENDYIYFFIPYSIKILFLPFTLLYICIKNIFKESKSDNFCYCFYSCCK